MMSENAPTAAQVFQPAKIQPATHFLNYLFPPPILEGHLDLY